MEFRNVRGYVKNSFSDWPGKVTTVIFLGSCNFKCPTCHNFELVYETALEIPFDNVLSHIRNNLKWLDGIVVSGGEPTINRQIFDLSYFLSSFLPLKIDTNGSMPYVVEGLIPYVDKFSVDIKGPWEKYPKLTGYNIKEHTIKECFYEIFSLANKYKDKFEFRTTFVPYLDQNDIETIKTYLPSGFNLKVQNYQEV